MPFTETGIEGLKIWEPKVLEDSRGFFMESYNRNVFREAGIDTEFVQDNRSLSHKGVLRGLHFQIGSCAQAKLVSVLHGEVIDIVVDVRRESKTFGQTYSIVLNAKNRKQLFVPRGFAHGFVVLEDNTEFFYKCDNFYSKENERGILMSDPALKIELPFAENELIISDKDKALPLFADSLRDLYFS